MDTQIRKNLENFLAVMPSYTIRADGTLKRDTIKDVIRKFEGDKKSEKKNIKMK